MKKMKNMVSEVGVCGGEASVFPPGFRFHPTDEELVLYYLKRKICCKRLKLDIIVQHDVYKCHPEDFPGLCRVRTGDRQWFFFSPRDRKYPNGGRSNRASPHGYWKITGKDRTITCNSRNVGIKKTLVFYLRHAPSGQRTDWVMHEYSLDEEELKRCSGVHEVFVLCKVYKKSGPGPKNGEQYGAPFREEDWADDDCTDDIQSLFCQENSVKKCKKIVPADCIENLSLVSHPTNGLEEIINRVADEAMPAKPLDTNCDLGQKVAVGEESNCPLVDSSSREANVIELSEVPRPKIQQYDVHTSFDLTQSGTTQFHLHEAPEIKSDLNNSRLQPCVIEEDFLENFLELDDLVGPELTPLDFNIPLNPGDFLLDELDGFGEFDLFQDAALFLNENGLDEERQISQSNMNMFERLTDETREGSDLYTNNHEVESTHLKHASPPGSNNYNYAMLNANLHSNSQNSENDMLSHQWSGLQDSVQFGELWRYDQQYRVPAPAVGNHITIPSSTPGVVYDVSSESNPTGLHKTQNVKPDEHIGSWYALWAFVESIPTTHASATKTAVVTKAFERMPSFSRLRMNSKKMNVAAGNHSAILISGKPKNEIICISLFGVLSAISWMLMVSSVKLLRRYISSYTEMKIYHSNLFFS